MWVKNKGSNGNLKVDFQSPPDPWCLIKSPHSHLAMCLTEALSFC